MMFVFFLFSVLRSGDTTLDRLSAQHMYNINTQTPRMLTVYYDFFCLFVFVT